MFRSETSSKLPTNWPAITLGVLALLVLGLLAVARLLRIRVSTWTAIGGVAIGGIALMLSGIFSQTIQDQARARPEPPARLS